MLQRFGLPFVVFAVIVAFVAFGLCLPQLNATQSGTKWALLVGIDDYENDDINDLRFAVADVKAVADALKENAGFSQENVLIMTSDIQPNDIKRPTHINIVKQLSNLAREVKSNDTFLFYFSGHGYSRDGRHFLATVNADPESVETLTLSSIPVDMLREKMSKIQAHRVIFIIDTCRNDPEKWIRSYSLPTARL
jgi:uncharacterized caspase-like protein